MQFGEKINLSQKIMYKYNPRLDVEILGPLGEEFNYRNKCVYTFNLEKNLLDQVSFNIIGLEHSKIIQYLNIRNSKDSLFTKNKYGILDIFIKNNWKQEYQICLCVYCVEDQFLDKLTAYLFNLMKSIIQDLNINIVSAYYHIYNKKISLKSRDFQLFYGVNKLEEQISILNLGKKTIHLSPHSFSRVNYLNSQIIYQKIWDVCSHLSTKKKCKYIMFGRDLYYPMKILLNLPTKIGVWGITHCPITYRDVIEDSDYDFNSICQFVKKSSYVDTISSHIRQDCEYQEVKYVFVLTAGRNGLGEKLCQMLLDFHSQIDTIIYVGCNRKNMDADLGRLVGNKKFQIEKAYISNEFSLTEYNNNILILN